MGICNLFNWSIYGINYQFNKEITMVKMKDFVDDFLHIVNNDMRDTYEHREWDWENLPEIEIMFEVMRRYEKKKGKDKKEDAK